MVLTFICIFRKKKYTQPIQKCLNWFRVALCSNKTGRNASSQCGVYLKIIMVYLACMCASECIKFRNNKGIFACFIAKMECIIELCVWIISVSRCSRNSWSNKNFRLAVFSDLCNFVCFSLFKTCFQHSRTAHFVYYFSVTSLKIRNLLFFTHFS